MQNRNIWICLPHLSSWRRHRCLAVLLQDRSQVKLQGVTCHWQHFCCLEAYLHEVESGYTFCDDCRNVQSPSCNLCCNISVERPIKTCCSKTIPSFYFLSKRLQDKLQETLHCSVLNIPNHPTPIPKINSLRDKLVSVTPPLSLVLICRLWSATLIVSVRATYGSTQSTESSS